MRDSNSQPLDYETSALPIAPMSLPQRNTKGFVGPNYFESSKRSLLKSYLALFEIKFIRRAFG